MIFSTSHMPATMRDGRTQVDPNEHRLPDATSVHEPPAKHRTGLISSNAREDPNETIVHGFTCLTSKESGSWATTRVGRSASRAVVAPIRPVLTARPTATFRRSSPAPRSQLGRRSPGQQTWRPHFVKPRPPQRRTSDALTTWLPARLSSSAARARPCWCSGSAPASSRPTRCDHRSVAAGTAVPVSRRSAASRARRRSSSRPPTSRASEALLERGDAAGERIDRAQLRRGVVEPVAIRSITPTTARRGRSTRRAVRPRRRRPASKSRLRPSSSSSSFVPR